MNSKLQELTQQIAKQIKHEDLHGGFVYLIDRDSKAGSAIVGFKESELLFAAAYLISTTAKLSNTSVEHTISECQRCLDAYFLRPTLSGNLEN